MKTRSFDVGSVLVLCLAATACVRGVDNTKVRCTSSEYCPNGYVCSAGRCVSGSASTGGTPGRDGALADATAAADAHPDQALGSDATANRGDAPSSGSDADVGPVSPGAGGTAGTGAGGMVGAGGVLGTGGVSGTGDGGALAGALGSGGVVGSGGIAPSGGTVATGGIAATGGLASSGGINGTGGAGSGGAGTGGTPCQPKSRDCTSTLDNNCNGTPDNQETSSCQCPAGQSRACQEHPGYDGKGICKAGNQKCEASTDKTTSSWTDCTGAVGPNPSEVCDATGLDENCNGQSNEGCECVNGAQVPCECGPATTCVNGKKGTCSVSKVTLYLDSDRDGSGNPARPGLVCPGTPDYVSNADDCDDVDGTFKAGVSICSTDASQRRSCATGGGGVTATESCPHGCLNGSCRPASDGTIGLPGYVSCDVKGCPAAQGCTWGAAECGTNASPGPVHCDGPNDCPGAQCCVYYGRGGVYSQCESGACPASYYPACDPKVIAAGCSCTLNVDNFPIYVCL